MSDLLFCRGQHLEAARLLAEFAARYHDGLAGRPVFPDLDREALRALMDAPLPESGVPLAALFDELERVVE